MTGPSLRVARAAARRSLKSAWHPNCRRWSCPDIGAVHAMPPKRGAAQVGCVAQALCTWPVAQACADACIAQQKKEEAAASMADCPEPAAAAAVPRPKRARRVAAQPNPAPEHVNLEKESKKPTRRRARTQAVEASDAAGSTAVAAADCKDAPQITGLWLM